MKHTILITGAAGYVGAMLCRHFSAREDVERVIALDKEPEPEFLRGTDKLIYIERNVADEWESGVEPYHPDVVIHAAWQIREMYGKQDEEWRSNIDGSEKVFRYAFNHPHVERLVYFSTVASYGAFPDNTIEHRFTESEPFRTTDYRYAEEKRVAEERLRALWDTRANKDIQVDVVRPAAITGPRGRYMRVRFGLQSALMGQLRGGIYRIVSLLTAVVPVTKKWCRQFIHEDDVVSIVEILAFGAPRYGEFNVYNICPPGPVVLGEDMARAAGKRLVRVHPYLVRAAFFVLWHLSRGRVPTGRGAWKGYSYPIAVDGSKLTRERGYRYTHPSFDAFYYTDGAYEEFVPSHLRRSKL
ncbi:MAG: NAD-dependent epimerase/dehydratase family protein [Patescibacteria group bacterium]|nr:NAD-dependent epimerase/dehydratase family protein [Patescibacteria group bacterium]